MKQLYVICAYGGSYEDIWEEHRFVTDDEAKGNLFVEKMNARREELIKIEMVIDSWIRTWKRNNPFEKTCTISKQEDSKSYRLAVIDWDKEAIAAWNEWKNKTYSKDILEDLKNNLQETSWRIEPISWLN